MDEYKEVIQCPKCNSESISFDKKGFSFGKAVAGVALLNPVGALAGFIGSNKVKATCLACGKTFNPKDGYKKIYIRNSNRDTEPEPEFISNKSEISKIVSKAYTEDEIVKKFKVWDSLCERGLITKEELEKKKADFLK